jgi:hypothetical protein
VLVLSAEGFQGFNGRKFPNSFADGGCIIVEGEHEGFSKIEGGIIKHCPTIGKVDDSCASADKEAGQGSEDMRFSDTFAP